MKLKTIVGLFALLLATLAISLRGTRHFEDDLPPTEEIVVEFGETMIPREVVSIDIPVEYTTITATHPSRITTSETAVIAVKLDRFSFKRDPVSGEKFKLTGSLADDSSIELAASAFDVAPESAISRTSATSLPTDFKWTLTPKLKGTHVALLDYSKLIPKPPEGDEDLYSHKLLVNGVEVSSDYVATIELNLSVLTIWGVSERVYLVLAGFVGLTGFILMYPVLTALWKAKLRLGSND